MGWLWGTLLGVAVVIFVQPQFYALQYLYFLRFPILIGLALVLLPLAGLRSGSPIENLFVLNGPGILITSSAALLSAWVVQYTFGLLWIHLPARVGLRFRKPDASHPPDPTAPNGLGPFESLTLRLAVFSLLALPVITMSVSRSVAEESIGSWGSGILWALGGVLTVSGSVAAALLVMKRVSRHRPAGRWLTKLFSSVATIPGKLDKRIFRGEIGGWTGYESEKDDPRRRHFHHQNAVFFAASTFVAYFVGYFLLKPGGPAAGTAGTLVYILLILLVLGWILPFFSFEFDKYRVPPELVLVVLVALVYSSFGMDHFYRIEEYRCSEERSATDRLRPEGFVEAWLKERDSPRMVVVAASGGGITASYWTATVLTRLEETFPGFGSNVALVSSTSGGSVGSMYYVERFEENSPPRGKQLEAIRRAAGRSSLAALGWGMAYPDLLRVLFPVLAFRGKDRGSALETRWEQKHLDPGKPPTLRGWQEDAQDGWRPAVIFNATLVENGERYLLSSLDLADPEHRSDEELVRFRSFDELFPGADLNVATAARLSATFPWVTPVARPDLPDGCGDLYHVADGGYYDNFGVMSAVEFIYTVLERYSKACDTERVLLLEIRAGDSRSSEPPVLDAGFRHETLGPADTMLSVRTASQLARNDLDVHLLDDVTESSGVKLHRAIFELRSSDVPLSWHLSESDKEKICKHWGAAHVQSALEEVSDFLGREPPDADPDLRRKECREEIAGATGSDGSSGGPSGT